MSELNIFMQANRRFDDRIKRLMLAGAVVHEIKDSHKNIMGVLLYGEFISGTELSWKPTEAFDDHIIKIFEGRA